jgi:hypothetical protein
LFAREATAATGGLPEGCEVHRWSFSARQSAGFLQRYPSVNLPERIGIFRPALAAAGQEGQS